MAKSKKSEATLTLEEKLEQALIADEEQPYKAPDNWCWTTLKSISNLYNGDRGSNYPSKKDYVTEGVPFINAGAIQNNTLEHIEFNYITQQKYESLRAGKIQKNDILYCLRGSLGKTAIIETDIMGAISSSLCIIRTKKDVLPKYLAYLLRTELITQQQDFAENGSAQPNLSAASVMEYKLPLAPLAEQQRIVDRIERMFSKLDEVKENAQNVIDGFENRKSAILHKAFNGELTAKWREENNRNIAEWKNKKLGEYAFVTKLAGFEYTKNIAPNLVNNGVPLFKGKNVQEGTLILKFESFIPKSVSDELPRSKLTKKCLLTPYVGTIGNIALFDGSFEAHLGSNVGKIEIEKETFEEYLLYYLRSDFGYKELTKQKKATAQESISIQAIRDVITILPSLEEQHEIVRILDSTLSKEQQAKEKAEEVLERIELIKKSILARAFRGELGTNNPDEESSIELLKTVLSEDKDAKINSKSKSK